MMSNENIQKSKIIVDDDWKSKVQAEKEQIKSQAASPAGPSNAKSAEPATKPQDTKPQDTKPQDTKPQDTKPQDTKPQDTKPQDTKPQDTKPQDTKQNSVPEDHTLPPPTFSFHITTLATQALHCLGQFPNPEDKSTVFRPNEGKHYIDTLAMLQEKTKGNLSASESTMLDNVLHELRMVFVALKNAKDKS